MLQSDRIIIALLTFTSLITTGAILAVSYIYNDINQFYDIELKEIDEFKHYANDAWYNMIHSEEPNYHALHALLQRSKRANVVCHCAPRAQKCPVGPQGLPGAKGLPGEDAPPGEPGRPGTPGISIRTASPGGCIKCPIGPPGPPGDDGEIGLPGEDGKPGFAYGRPTIGKPGPPGPQGDAGTPGEPGPPGSTGAPGESAITGPSLPGPRGVPGTPGLAGEPGKPGEVTADGRVGPPGAPGHPGKPGTTGPDGVPGPPGAPGRPGEDAQYCPCPPRTADIEHEGLRSRAVDNFAAIAPRFRVRASRGYSRRRLLHKLRRQLSKAI